MNRIKYFNDLVALMALTLTLTCAGCRDVDEPLVPVPEKGFILAGEAGDRVAVQNFDYYTGGVSGGSGNINYRDLVLDSSLGASLRISGTTSSSSTNSYAGSNIGGTAGLVEIALLQLKDSAMVCYDLSPDSMSGTITYFHTSEQHLCAGQLYFEHLDSILSPMRYAAGTRIDASLPWIGRAGIFASLGSYAQYGGGFGPDILHEAFHRLWSLYPGYHYLAFRLWDVDHWRYGYVELSAGDSFVNVKTIGLER